MTMYKSAHFRLHLIVFLWGFTAILGKLIHANAEVLVFYRMIFAATFLYIFIRFIKKDSIKVKKRYETKSNMVCCIHCNILQQPCNNSEICT